MMFDVLPDISDAPGRQTVSELRTRLFVERRDQAAITESAFTSPPMHYIAIRN